MSSLFRLLRILHTIGRYRLIDLLVLKRFSRYRLLILPLMLYPKSQLSRGLRLRRALEDLGPIFIKFGQLLSTRPDIIPPDIIEELIYLQDRVPPFPEDEFIRIVEQTLGQDVNSAFKHFEKKPLASASIAQVHGAVLQDGAHVVVKIVRPTIEKIIDQDTKLLGIIAKWVESFFPEGKRLRPVEVVRDYKDTIFDELDLSKEGANAAQLRRNFEQSDTLYIPKIFWDLSHRNMLVIERIYGIPVNDIDALKAQNTNLKLLAERGVDIFFKQVFDHNFFHADMHPGNVFVSHNNPQSPSYIAVDMAIVGSLTKEDQYYLARNLIAMFRRDYRLVAELHVSSGWVPEHTSVAGFESAIRSVCEPIFQKPLKDISFGEALISLFRTAQRYEMPVQPQLVLLQKTLLNIEGLGRQLYPELDLWETAHPYLETWLKERYHPKNIWREIKYNAPAWIESFPQVPDLVFDTMKEVKNLAAIAPQLTQASDMMAKREKKVRLKKTMSIGLISTSFLAYLLIPSNELAPKELISFFLLLLGLVALR